MPVPTIPTIVFSSPWHVSSPLCYIHLCAKNAVSSITTAMWNDVLSITPSFPFPSTSLWAWSLEPANPQFHQITTTSCSLQSMTRANKYILRHLHFSLLLSCHLIHHFTVTNHWFFSPILLIYRQRDHCFNSKYWLTSPFKSIREIWSTKTPLVMQNTKCLDGRSITCRGMRGWHHNISFIIYFLRLFLLPPETDCSKLLFFTDTFCLLLYLLLPVPNDIGFLILI